MRLNALESSGVAAAAPDTVVEDITNRILAIEEQTTAPAPDPRVDELLSKVSLFESSAESPAADPRVNELVSRLDSLSERLAEPVADDPRVAEMSSRLVELEGRLSTESEPADIQPVLERLQKLEERKVIPGEGVPEDVLIEMGAKLDSLEQRLNEEKAAEPSEPEKAAIDVARSLGGEIAEKLQQAGRRDEITAIKSLQSNVTWAWIVLGALCALWLIFRFILTV